MTIPTRHHAVQCLLLAAAALSAGCQAVGENKTATRTTELTVPLANVARLEIVTDVGNITVKSADTDQCQIVTRVSAQAHTEENAQARVDKIPVSVLAAGEVLRVKVPSPSVLGTNPYHIDLTIVAPRNLALNCRTEVGDIRIAGFDQEIEARTNVGNLLCTDLRSETKLHTDVGDIRATYQQDAPAVLCARMTTGVGSIVVHGPARISALLTAVVHKGTIDLDNKLGIAGPVAKSIEVPVGEAQGRIELRVTQRGSIEFR